MADEQKFHKNDIIYGDFDSPWWNGKSLSQLIDDHFDRIITATEGGALYSHEMQRVKIIIDDHARFCDEEEFRDVFLINGVSFHYLKYEVKEVKELFPLIETQLDEIAINRKDLEKEENKRLEDNVTLRIEKNKTLHERALQFSKYILIAQGASVLALLNMPVKPGAFVTGQGNLIICLWILTGGILTNLLSEISKRSEKSTGWLKPHENWMHNFAVISLVLMLIVFLAPHTLELFQIEWPWN